MGEEEEGQMTKKLSRRYEAGQIASAVQTSLVEGIIKEAGPSKFRVITIAAVHHSSPRQPSGTGDRYAARRAES